MRPFPDMCLGASLRVNSTYGGSWNFPGVVSPGGMSLGARSSTETGRSWSLGDQFWVGSSWGAAGGLSVEAAPRRASLLGKTSADLRPRLVLRGF